MGVNTEERQTEMSSATITYPPFHIPHSAHQASRVDVAKRGVRLTPREVEVLSLVAQGYSREAADVLFLSKRTVDFHLANIYDKLQVNNRVQAFRAATRLGLIPFEPAFGEIRD